MIDNTMVNIFTNKRVLGIYYDYYAKWKACTHNSAFPEQPNFLSFHRDLINLQYPTLI